MSAATDPTVLRCALRSASALLDDEDSPFADPRLHVDVAERLLAEADALKGGVEPRIEFSLPEWSPAETERIHLACRLHFEAVAADADRELAGVFRRARRATLIGLLVVVVLLGAANAIDPETTSRLLRGVRESLTIFAWVAMWRPAELWLYEHLPVRRRRQLAWRLAGAPVSLVRRAPDAAALASTAAGHGNNRHAS